MKYTQFPGAIPIHKGIGLYEIPHFLTNQECDSIIEEAHRIGFDDSTVIETKSKTGRAKSKARTSQTCSFPDIKNDPKNKKPYANAYRRVLDLFPGIPAERMQIQKYTKGQLYEGHFDSFDHEQGKNQRNYTVILYLNTVSKDEGGGTQFPKLGDDVIVHPETGKAVIWKNLDDHACRDPLTLHAGMPILGKETTKYIATIWFRNPGDGPEYTCQMTKIGDLFNTNTKVSGTTYGWIVGVLVTLIIIMVVFYLLFK